MCIYFGIDMGGDAMTEEYFQDGIRLPLSTDKPKLNHRLISDTLRLIVEAEGILEGLHMKVNYLSFEHKERMKLALADLHARLNMLLQEFNEEIDNA